ncbi:MAG: hypothetical protein NTY09_11135, partial [bacterium]|nr:hypothetical protein [bacterium]
TWSSDMDGCIINLYLFDSSLSLLYVSTIPSPFDAWVLGLFPSQDDSFWVLYMTSENEFSDQAHFERNMVRFFANGTISTPEIQYSGNESDAGPQQTRFITPSGCPIQSVTDQYGYTYRGFDETQDATMGRFSPEGDLVFTHNIPFDPKWHWHPSFLYNYFVSWSGDFYTLHASDEGTVLTKYTLYME